MDRRNLLKASAATVFGASAIGHVAAHHSNVPHTHEYKNDQLGLWASELEAYHTRIAQHQHWNPEGSACAVPFHTHMPGRRISVDCFKDLEPPRLDDLVLLIRYRQPVDLTGLMQRLWGNMTLCPTVTKEQLLHGPHKVERCMSMLYQFDLDDLRQTTSRLLGAILLEMRAGMQHVILSQLSQAIDTFQAAGPRPYTIDYHQAPVEVFQEYKGCEWHVFAAVLCAGRLNPVVV